MPTPLETEAQQTRAKVFRREILRVRREGFAEVNLERIPIVKGLAERAMPKANGGHGEQLETAFEAVVQALTQHQDVVRTWFGMTEASEGKDHHERTKLAATEAGYETSKGFENNLQPELVDDIGKMLVGFAKRDSSARADTEKIEPTDEAPGPPPDPSPAPEITVRPRRTVPILNLVRRAWLPISWIAVVLLTVLVLDLSVGTSGTSVSDTVDPTERPPPPDTLVSAEDGSAVGEPDQVYIGQSAIEPVTGALRACDVTTVGGKGNCDFLPPNGPLPVGNGDTLWIGRSLSEKGRVRVPYVTLRVLGDEKNGRSVVAEVVVEVPGTRAQDYRSKQVWRTTRFQLPRKYDYLKLVYVPGSTELRGPLWPDFIAHLPDGIMGGGVSLANVGPPLSCYGCASEYKRYVFFEARVEGRYAFRE